MFGRVDSAPIDIRAHGSFANLLEHGLSEAKKVTNHLILKQQQLERHVQAQHN